MVMFIPWVPRIRKKSPEHQTKVPEGGPLVVINGVVTPLIGVK